MKEINGFRLHLERNGKKRKVVILSGPKPACGEIVCIEAEEWKVLSVKPTLVFDVTPSAAPEAKEP
jgi:hypothetical protein